VAYSWKHKVISWVSKNLFDSYTYTVRNGLNKGMRRRGGLGWVPVAPDVTPELLFWQGLDVKNKVVYDVGAFHGILTLFFAKQARAVVAFEPNSHNRKRLLENLALNGFSNVTIRPYGLASKPERQEMSFDPLAPGTASVDSKLRKAGLEHEIIELRVLDDEQGLPEPDLIKVDVEGFELEVLRGAPRTLARKPQLFLEMHGADPEDKQNRVRAIVEYLWQQGYRNIQHVETQQQITPENTAVAAQGHLYVRP
jgi:FkbM family methyltransferase